MKDIDIEKIEKIYKQLNLVLYKEKYWSFMSKVKGNKKSEDITQVPLHKD